MTPYCTSSGMFSGMVCLFAWNSPPKYDFNRWVLTLNVPFSGCVTAAPPCRKTWVTMNGPDHLDFNFSGKSLSQELSKRTCCPASTSFLAIYYRARISSFPCICKNSHKLHYGIHPIH